MNYLKNVHDVAEKYLYGEHTVYAKCTNCGTPWVYDNQERLGVDRPLCVKCEKGYQDMQNSPVLSPATHLTCPYCPSQAFPNERKGDIERRLGRHHHKLIMYVCPAQHAFYVEAEQ